VSIAGIADLSAYRLAGPGACGEPETIDRLIGAAVRQPQEAFTDTSPAALLPIGVRQTIISGELDPIVPPTFGHEYAATAASAGDAAREITIPGAGHFELIDPQSSAFAQVRSAIEQLQK
jgi:pimeloyl-ACP methyl ester carboxylesterase